MAVTVVIVGPLCRPALGAGPAGGSGWGEVAFAAGIGLAALAALAWLWARDAIRPGSFRRRAAREPREHGSLVWFGAALLVIFGGGLLGVMTDSLCERAGLSRDALPRMATVGLVATLGAGLIGAGVMAVLRARGASTRGPSLGDVPRGLGWLVLAMPITVATTMVSVIVHDRLFGAQPERHGHAYLPAMVENLGSVWGWVLIASAVVGAGIAEEMIYRVFLQTGLLRLTRRPWIAIVVTSALFAAAHAPGALVGSPEEDPVPAMMLPGLFVLSVLLGVAYERTRRDAVPMVMHMGFNALNIAWAASA